MASLPQWTGVWANYRTWWRTAKPGMLQSLGLQRVLLRDWTTTIKGGAATKPPEARLKEPERLIKIRRPPETLHMTYQQPHSWSNVIKLFIKSSQIRTYSFSRQKHSVPSFAWKSGKAILFCCCSSVLQSLSHAQLFAIPCTCNSMCRPVSCALHHPLEFAQTRVHWFHDTFQPSILCHPLLLLLSIFPSIRIFSNESVLCIRWLKYWSFSLNISPSNEYSGLINL